MPQISSLGENKSSLQNWESATDVADSDRNMSDSFDCNICLDSVQEPVVTQCGHLYCWPCIYKWIHLHSISESDEPERPQCPVCKSEVSQSSLIPLYGRGQASKPSKGKASKVGIVIPGRPLGPPRMVDPSRSANAATTSQPPPRYYHRQNPYHYQHFNSIPSIYNSSVMHGRGGLPSNAFDTTVGVFGEMIYARVFGNQVTNMYSSYQLSGNGNPRIRRQLMQADRSLSRICFFLLCSVIFCLLLF